MALRLRIISDHRRVLGERSSVVFDGGGGSIGRATDNDWVLPDPLRYMSAHHARIHFRDGRYLLEDVSTNGVFVNDDEQPLGQRGPHPLQNGDVLRLGDYQMVVVELEAARATQASPAAVATADPVPTHVDGLRAVGRVSQTDLGAALNLNDLLVAGESPTGSGVRPVNAYGQAVAAMTDTQTDEEEQAVARRMERLARAAAKAREAKGTSLPALYDVHAGLQTFCRGAGIDTQTLPAEAQTRLLHLAGQLVREALVGLKDLERARREIHNRFRIELPEAEDDPRPSLARSTIEELLVELFGQHESRRLDAVQWLRDTVEGSKAHERATMEAMREAFVEFIERFNPAELEARFQRSSRRGKKSAGGEAHWEMFAEFYRNLTEMPPDHLPHTFVEAFALAYKKNLTG
ncbi:MAG TPA: type VI secretion system-associated FHA domain protein TagH [Steroidobacteraceae bacterium]|jgi:type VI secretion system FHA domain protein|nr:type VI secretion system-associated FHA domain protein TagH [Steroidobacteraceae bacterium]